MKNCTLYPSYLVIKGAREEYFPNKDQIIFQEYLAEVNMQAFVKKTALQSIHSFIL
jgi:hypothetical protein